MATTTTTKSGIEDWCGETEKNNNNNEKKEHRAAHQQLNSMESTEKMYHKQQLT